MTTDGNTDEVIKNVAKLLQNYIRTDWDKLEIYTRRAVERYYEIKKESTVNEQHRELETLHRLASTRMYEQLAIALENISAEARIHLEDREAIVSDRVDWRVPTPGELRDPATQLRAAQNIEALAEIGGKLVPGRKRPTGKQSAKTWHPVLNAPPPSRGEPRRAAEREFVAWLQFAVAEAAGSVPVTAHHNTPGPFARMAGDALIAVGAIGPANAVKLAVQLINDLQEARTELKPSEKPPCRA